MAVEVKHVLTLAANAFLGIAIVVFAIGFFPHKAVLPGLAIWSSSTQHIEHASPFDKVIFMVVDALRSDFVYGNESSFHFTQSLIRSGAAVPFTGYASPPTITMPRVKAITTGSVPSFIDLILNFAESDTTSTLAMQDSWLAQLKAKPQSKLVMFGDDTWLRLFPDFFERSDGTTSFFVSDFTEVDHNVTRNIARELKKEDWSGMILHYLGLDHIGHKTGPQGPNMPAKQREMDGIVKQIYLAMEQNSHLQSSLLVLLGDHGMNEAGNHGGSSAGETATALTFISPKFKTAFEGSQSPIHGVVDYQYYDVVEQSDIAATLAALLGFPIPLNSLGIVIPRMLELWTSDTDHYDLLYANAEQMMRIAKATFVGSFDENAYQRCRTLAGLSDEDKLGCQWQKVAATRPHVQQPEVSLSSAINEVTIFLKDAQSALSRTASKYDLNKMGIGIGLVTVALLLSVCAVGRHILDSGLAGMALTTVIILYAITMFASSYVEEEHQFWYWSLAAWLFLLTSKARRLGNISSSLSVLLNILVFVAFGVVRRWNQTGQKYAGEADLVTEMLSKNPWLLWGSVLVTYAVISRRLSRKARSWGSTQMALLPVIVVISAFLFKLAFTAADAPELLQGITIFDPILNFITRYPLFSLARIVFLGIAHLAATAFFYELPWTSSSHKRAFLEPMHDIVSLLLVTQTRTVNIPLYSFFYLQMGCLQEYQYLRDLELTLTSLLFQFAAFFALGGTNAISSVDLSNAYNGVSGYNVLVVGILTFVSNWTGPIWWTSATSCLLQKNTSNPQTDTSSNHYGVLTLFTSACTLSVMTACFVLREHLFIWTVFSPKYLYVMAWTFIHHFVINGVFGSFLFGVAHD